jgi:hypothetical protein
LNIGLAKEKSFFPNLLVLFGLGLRNSYFTEFQRGFAELRTTNYSVRILSMACLSLWVSESVIIFIYVLLSEPAFALGNPLQ